MPPSSAITRPLRWPLALALLPLLAGAPRARSFVPQEERARAVVASAADDTPSEYELKAVYLLHIIRYSTWPKDTFKNDKAPIVLQVVGKDPFGSVLEKTFEGKKVGGRKIEVHRSRGIPTKIDAHLVFCSGLSKKGRDQLIGLCTRKPVLLIGESKGFAEDGACVNFFLEKRKVRFEINTGAAKQAGIELSPQLLRLAKIVKTRKRG